jgi:hypothetical protein
MLILTQFMLQENILEAISNPGSNIMTNGISSVWTYNYMKIVWVQLKILYYIS